MKSNSNIINFFDFAPKGYARKKPEINQPIFHEANLCSVHEIEGKSDKELSLVWPNEGCMTDRGFKFNQKHVQCKPLLVDSITQNLLKNGLILLEPKVRARTLELIQSSRESFYQLIKIFMRQAA
jgi:hypothetical protein